MSFLKVLLTLATRMVIPYYFNTYIYSIGLEDIHSIRIYTTDKTKTNLY